MWAITIFTTYICVSVCSALWEHTALLRVQVIFAFSASTVQVVFIKYRMEKLNRNTRYGTPAKKAIHDMQMPPKSCIYWIGKQKRH